MKKKNIVKEETGSIFIAVIIILTLFNNFDTLNNIEPGVKTVLIGLLSSITYKVIEFLRNFLAKER
jgi:hypothetical protein